MHSDAPRATSSRDCILTFQRGVVLRPVVSPLDCLLRDPSLVPNGPLNYNLGCELGTLHYPPHLTGTPRRGAAMPLREVEMMMNHI